MKKIFWYTLATVTALSLLLSCNKDKKGEVEPETKTVATLVQTGLINAAADAYAAWEEDSVIPGELKVGDVTLTLP